MWSGLDGKLAQKEQEFSALADPVQHHRRSYHNFFAGYEEGSRIDAKGRKRTYRIYAGTYYEINMTGTGNILIRLSEMIMLILGCFFFILASIENVPMNYYFAIVFLTGLTGLLLLWLLVSFLNYALTPRKMTEGDYSIFRCYVRAVIRAAVSAGVLCLLKLFFALWLHTLTQSEILKNIGEISAGELLFCAVILLNIYTERKIRTYTE